MHPELWAAKIMHLKDLIKLYEWTMFQGDIPSQDTMFLDHLCKFMGLSRETVKEKEQVYPEGLLNFLGKSAQIVQVSIGEKDRHEALIEHFSEYYNSLLPWYKRWFGGRL